MSDFDISVAQCARRLNSTVVNVESKRDSLYLRVFRNKQHYTKSSQIHILNTLQCIGTVGNPQKPSLTTNTTVDNNHSSLGIDT